MSYAIFVTFLVQKNAINLLLPNPYVIVTFFVQKNAISLLFPNWIVVSKNLSP